jgi:hypothetical protein
MAKLKDPVRQQGEDVKGEMKTVDDFVFTPVKPEAARVTRPFDGYPLKKKIKIGETKDKHDKVKDVMISATYLVALNPTIQVRQDPSNRKTKNYHSRMIRDYEEQDNIVVVFDRVMEIKGQKYFYAIVPQHYVRAQLIFKYDNNKQRVEVDPNYLLMDGDQDQRLKRVFEMMINPKLKVERESAFIAGESQKDGGESEPLTEETGV